MYEKIKVDLWNEAATTAIGQSLPPIQYDLMVGTMCEITIPPGGETGWHYHPSGVRLFCFVESGSLRMRYQSGKEVTFTAPSAFIEAILEVHNGDNPGTTPVVLKMVAVHEKGEKVAIPTAHPELT